MGLGLVLSGARGEAQPTAACNNLDARIEEAIRLRERGQDIAGWAMFRDLHARCPSPRVVAQLGIAEHAMRRFVDALGHLDEALEAHGDRWVTTRRAALLALRQEVVAHIGFLEASANVPGAELFAAGVSLGRLPLDHALAFNEGPLDLEVRAPGYVAQHTHVEVAGTQTHRVSVTLAATPVARVAAPALPPAAPAPSRFTTTRVAGLVLLGVGVIASGVGVYFWAQTADSAERMQNAGAMAPDPYGAWARYDAAINTPQRLDVDGLCARASADSASSFDAATVNTLCENQTRNRVAAFALGLSGLALAGVGTLLVVRGGRSHAAPRVALTPWLWQQQGLSATVRF